MSDRLNWDDERLVRNDSRLDRQPCRLQSWYRETQLNVDYGGPDFG